ncbi:MAG: helix-turn-helix transcriptional regulator [Verrucomicrobia bacterium]|nr:helix-turn-helix transcriptional regulator [Verrucomicrobiota bacterium]
MRPLFHPAVNDITVEGILYALSDPVRAQIYTEMLASECPLNCSSFRKVDNRTLPKATLSQHFKILREAGLIRSERKGVEMHNTTRCTELKERFGDMLSAILSTYVAQNSQRTAFPPGGRFPSNARRRSLHGIPSNRSDQR